MIWKQKYSLSLINQMSTGTLVETLGITIDDIGNDYLKGSMPVDHRTRQPMGLLHGGASAALAETLGSIASLLMLDPNEGSVPVGVNLQVNHLNSVTDGKVYGKVTPVKTGKTIHLWQVEIADEKGKPVCFGTLSVFIKKS
jgi:1,4-dihydroxy-2-naphthoyl-CoA hydrolase